MAVRQEDIVFVLDNLKPTDNARDILIGLLIGGLTGLQKKVYDHVCDSDNPITGRELADELGLSLSHAINILNRLESMKLVSAIPNVDDRQSHYVWSMRYV